MVLDGFDPEKYCQRIRQLRRAFNMNQTQFAHWLQIPLKKWNHYERGYPIPRDTAFILHKHIDGFSTDWLWFGNIAGLSQPLYNRLMDHAVDDRPHKPPKLCSPASKVRRRVNKPRHVST